MKKTIVVVFVLSALVVGCSRSDRYEFSPDARRRWNVALR